MNLVFERRGNRDLRVFRRYTGADVNAVKSNEIITSALWATFSQKNYLQLRKSDHKHLKAVYDYLEA